MRDQYAALDGLPVSSRLSQPSRPHAPGKPARFALSLPCAVPAAGCPDTRTGCQPIPRFCDMILCRGTLKLRYTIGHKGAKTIEWIPVASAPADAPPVILDGTAQPPQSRHGRIEPRSFPASLA